MGREDGHASKQTIAWNVSRRASITMRFMASMATMRSFFRVIALERRVACIEVAANTNGVSRVMRPMHVRIPAPASSMMQSPVMTIPWVPDAIDVTTIVMKAPMHFRMLPASMSAGHASRSSCMCTIIHRVTHRITRVSASDHACFAHARDVTAHAVIQRA